MKKNAFSLAIILAAGLAQVDASPTITDPNQPADANVFLGQSPVLTVAVSSATPVGYQWRFNDQPLDGQTNQSLVLVGAQSPFPESRHRFSSRYEPCCLGGIRASQTTARKRKDNNEN